MEGHRCRRPPTSHSVFCWPPFHICKEENNILKKNGMFPSSKDTVCAKFSLNGFSGSGIFTSQGVRGSRGGGAVLLNMADITGNEKN